jgi:hypothetical protein
VWLRYYAEQISRLEAFFFFDNLDWATNFAKGEPVYEIAPLDPAAKIERHIIEDYGSLLYPQDLEGRPATTIAAVEKNAHRYWNYAPRPQMTTELLTKGPVKVIRKI